MMMKLTRLTSTFIYLWYSRYPASDIQMLPLRLSRLGGGEEQQGMGGTRIQKASARHGQEGIRSLHWVFTPLAQIV